MKSFKTQFNKFAWHNVTNNREEEIRYLRDHFEFDPSDLTDCATPPLRPKIEFSQEYIFIVLLFPLYSRKSGSVSVSEIDIFLSKEYVVTVHKNEATVLTDLAQKIENEPRFRQSLQNQNPLKFLLDLLEALNNSLYPMLNHISWDIDGVDNQLFTGHERELINKILIIKRNIVAIRKAMRSQKSVFLELRSHADDYFSAKTISKRDNAQFARITSSSDDLWTHLENDMATIDAIHETNESLIGFRLNDIMKTLTIFSVIVFPLTLLAAIFGMNTTDSMPFTGHFGFWKVITVMVVGSCFMFYWFKSHKWI